MLATAIVELAGLGACKAWIARLTPLLILGLRCLPTRIATFMARRGTCIARKAHLHGDDDGASTREPSAASHSHSRSHSRSSSTYVDA